MESTDAVSTHQRILDSTEAHINESLRQLADVRKHTLAVRATIEATRKLMAQSRLLLLEPKD